MKFFITILLVSLLPIILGGQAIPHQNDLIATEVKALNKKLDAASEKLEIANKMLNSEQVETVLKSPRQKIITRTITKNVYVPTYVYDTIYIYDTIIIYRIPPTYGGDSVQKAQWRPDPDEGKFFKRIFKKRK